MRLLSLSLLFAIALPTLAQTKPTEYQIVQVNPRFSLLTLKINDSLTILQVRADTEVTIDGVKAAFNQLAPRMTVTVTLAGPGVAQRLEARDSITAAASPHPQPSPASTAHQ
jgi:hypothetical protein